MLYSTHTKIKGFVAPDEVFFKKQYKLIKKMMNWSDIQHTTPTDEERREKTEEAKRLLKEEIGLSDNQIEQLKRNMRYQCLIELMLSAQTKDAATYYALDRLKERGCTVDSILAMSKEDIEGLIFVVSFPEKKADYILRTTKILKEKYNGDIPPTVPLMKELPGVGPKIAVLTMTYGWGKVVGIGVDTHVHRISNRLGWVNTKIAEQTRVALEKFVPREEWQLIHLVLIGFGKEICYHARPQCHSCLLSREGICPYFAKKNRINLAN
jgi:endonuclease-3